MRNYIYVTLNLGFKLLANTVIFFIIARNWSLELFGEFALLITISSILVLIIEYGFQLNLVKVLSKNIENHDYIVDSFHSKNILCIFTILITLLIGLFLDAYIAISFLLIMLSYIINSYGNFFMLPFRAIGQNIYEMLFSILSNGILFVSILIAVQYNFKLLMISFIYLICRLIGTFYAYYKFKGLTKIKLQKLLSLSNGIKHITSNFSYAIHLIIGTLYYQVDTLIIKMILNSEAVGLYQAAVRIILGCLLATEILSIILLPILVKSQALNNYHIKKKLSIFLHFCVGIITSLSIFLASDFIINTIYGSKYNEAVIILQFLSIVLFMRFMTSSFGLILTVEDLQKERATIVLIGLIVTISLQLLFIYSFEILGIVYANILSNIILILMYIYVLKIKRRINK